jgi:hypothetical protein
MRGLSKGSRFRRGRLPLSPPPRQKIGGGFLFFLDSRPCLLVLTSCFTWRNMLLPDAGGLRRTACGLEKKKRKILQARSSVGERYPDTVEVGGSKPPVPTNF